ncbi:FAD-dependent monooxygenase [Streptomyces sp. ODS28]|uniref:FAD-dependent monooxygenase n=1 Tax=Streptomyces sp. ODS28 TaxID=3136688 RepID=UPI0031F1382C
MTHETEQGTAYDTDVIVAGAGPTGLMLACELRLGGAGVTVVERRSERTGESRSGGLHMRTMEVLAQRGVLDRFLARGRPVQAGHFSGLPLEFAHFGTEHPYVLLVLQSTVEELLQEWAAELGVEMRWSTGVTGFTQDATGVRAELENPADGMRSTVRARYLAGCDGGRSTVRKLAGIGFPGTPATLTALLGDVELADPPDESFMMRRGAHGDYSVLAFGPGWYRVVTAEHDHVADRDDPVDLETLRTSLVRLAGTDFGMHSPRWLSRFGDAARQAERYRDGRVLLAGDAAHIHYPAGGQGLNTGVQDAVNLGWKLASVVRGQAPASLLDSYHEERHPVAARVLHNTRAQTALARPGPHSDALRDMVGALLGEGGEGGPHDRLAAMISALDVRYPADGTHPLAGLRVPDVPLKTSEGGTSTFALLHPARPLLLDLGADLSTTARAWSDRVDYVQATLETDDWPTPADGPTQPPAALFIRPDGHAAWAASPQESPDTESLEAALRRWVGSGA